MSHSIYIADASDFLNEDIFNTAYSKVSMYRKLKIDKCRLDNDKARSLAAGLLLDYAIMQFVNKNEMTDIMKVSTEELLMFEKQAGYVVVDGEYGKPRISGHDDINFNISHSGKMVMVGIGATPIGVDVQEIKEIKTNIARRFFCDEEKKYLENFCDDEWQDKFFRVWALKESYVKYTGRGLGARLESFSVIDRIESNSFCQDGYAYAMWD